MLRQIGLSTALFVCAASGSFSQSPGRPDEVSMPPVITKPEQTNELSRNMRPLLVEVATWLSANFDLPPMREHPRMEIVPARSLVSMRYRGVLPESWREDSILDQDVQAAHQREVVAIYNDRTKTIFLADTWTGATPAELSVLVHEMVHHLQSAAGLRYACPQEREKLAYAAQEQWLARFGRSLADEFDIDAMTILVSTKCFN